MNEVYIDGCNVAECEFYTNLKMDCSLMPLQIFTCSKNPNCYFKQLQRAKAENEKLKKQHYETLKMLKHEYDGRRRDNEQWFTRCTENHNEDSKIIEKYRKALEDIRELGEKTGSMKLIEIVDEVLKHE